MAAPSMILASDLDGFPGGPFSQDMVDVAVASIRAEAGWHVAPVVTETISVVSEGGRRLFLPSLRVVSVASVTFGGVAVTDWYAGSDGVLFRFGCWPVGVVSVTLTHGYDSALDLVPAVASRLFDFTRDRSVVTQTDGPFSTAYRSDVGGMDAADPVSRYRIPVVA